MRIAIESALLDAQKKERLGADLAGRTQKILDDHQKALWRSIWPQEKALSRMGAISGRDTYEAIRDASAKAGIKLPDFWSGEARGMRAREDRNGIAWFVHSGWQQRNKQLFDAAAEVQQKLK